MLRYALPRIPPSAELLTALFDTLLGKVTPNTSELLEFCIEMSPRLSRLPVIGSQAVLTTTLETEDIAALMKLAKLLGQLRPLRLECEALLQHVCRLSVESTSQRLQQLEALVSLQFSGLLPTDLHFLWEQEGSQAFRLLLETQQVLSLIHI